MDPAQTIGILGLVTTTFVAVFTQAYQGSREDKRAKAAAVERHAERLYEARLGAYRELLAILSRRRELQHGDEPIPRDREGEARTLAFEIQRIETEVTLFAHDGVLEAMRRYEDAAQAWERKWVAWVAMDPDDPEREQANATNRTVSASEYEAHIALENAIRRDLSEGPSQGDART